MSLAPVTAPSAAAALRCDIAVAEVATASNAAAHQTTAPVQSVVAADSALVALFESGQPWTDFLTEARARRAQWLENAARPLAPADAVARARALPGRCACSWSPSIPAVTP